MMSRAKKLSIPTLLLSLLSVSFLLNVFLLFTSSNNSHKGTKVIGVIDGDTLVLEGKTKIRLRHVDSPELDYCGGQEAKNELETLVSGKTVVIEELIPDQRGRGMALIYNGNILVNEEMLKHGWGRYHSDTSSQKEQLKQAADRAKSEKIGLFSQCQSAIPTKNPRCSIKGNIDDNAASDKNKRYYTPDCAQYNFTVVEEDMGEGWFCSESEAQAAGFRKADTCKR